MAVMLLSLALTVALLLFQRHVVRITGSTAVRADSLHYASDLLLNAASCSPCCWPPWAGSAWTRCSA